MDNRYMGEAIRKSRRERGLTQAELAGRLHISDKTVSKWETGQGCPDVALLAALTRELGLDVADLLTGGPVEHEPAGGNMKKSRFYVCPVCGQLTASTGGSTVSCCGRTLEPLQAPKPDESHALQVELIDGERFVTTAHSMSKEHHISYVIYATGEQLLVTHLWPEWDLQVRLPGRGHGQLLWYCTRDGLFGKQI